MAAWTCLYCADMFDFWKEDSAWLLPFVWESILAKDNLYGKLCCLSEYWTSAVCEVVNQRKAMYAVQGSNMDGSMPIIDRSQHTLSP